MEMELEQENSRTRERTHFRTDTRPAVTAGESASAQARSNFTRHAPLEPGIPATASLSTQAVRWLDGASTEGRRVIGCAFRGRAKFEVPIDHAQSAGDGGASETRAQAVLCQSAALPSAFDERRTTHDARRTTYDVDSFVAWHHLRRRPLCIAAAYGQKPISRQPTLVTALPAHPARCPSVGLASILHGPLRDKPLWGAESAFEILHAARRTSRQERQEVVAGVMLAARAGRTSASWHAISLIEAVC